MIDIIGKILLIIGIVAFSISAPICIAILLIDIYNDIVDLFDGFRK